MKCHQVIFLHRSQDRPVRREVPGIRNSQQVPQHVLQESDTPQTVRITGRYTQTIQTHTMTVLREGSKEMVLMSKVQFSAMRGVLSRFGASAGVSSWVWALRRPLGGETFPHAVVVTKARDNHKPDAQVSSSSVKGYGLLIAVVLIAGLIFVFELRVSGA